MIIQLKFEQIHGRIILIQGGDRISPDDGQKEWFNVSEKETLWWLSLKAASHLFYVFTFPRNLTLNAHLWCQQF